MKTLLLSLIGIFLVFTSLQASAVVACSYSKEACDDQGNHFVCYSFGWSGDREFCSKTNLGPKSKRDNWFKECVADCVKETGKSEATCGGQYCW